MDQLVMRLRDVVVATDAYRRAGAEALGIGVPEAVTMVELLVRGPQTPSALVRRLGLTSASVTALLDRLERDKLVTRTRNLRDRRSILVELTDSGAAAIRPLYDLWSADVARALRDAVPADVAELSRLLEQVAVVLRACAEDPSRLALAATRLRTPADRD